MPHSTLAARTQVAKLRAERHAFLPDPRFHEVVRLIRSGAFGWQEFFAPLMDSVEGADHYLVANDFPAYLDIQVCSPHARCDSVAPSSCELAAMCVVRPVPADEQFAIHKLLCASNTTILCRCGQQCPRICSVLARCSCLQREKRRGERLILFAPYTPRQGVIANSNAMAARKPFGPVRYNHHHHMVYVGLRWC